MSNNLREQISKKIAAFTKSVESKLDDWSQARTPTDFRAMEREVASSCRLLSDEVTSVVLVDILAEPEFQAATSVAGRQDGKLRIGDRRDVSITLLGGNEVRLHDLEYLKPNHRRKRRGRKRTKRGPSGTGMYPSLVALGICFGVTPALAGEICAQVADSDSVRSGRAALARRDIDLGHKQTLRIVNGFSDRAVQQRNEWLAQARQEPTQDSLFKGKRVVIATDGGRLRERQNGSGRRRANGHRGYNAPWREPKLLVIYLLDDRGRVEHEFRPVYDGTLGDCEALFDMLTGYLRALGVRQAKQLIVLGDGAKWIWERVPALAEAVEIDPDKVVQVVDYYHASEKLHEIADIVASWSPAGKKRWLRQAKKLLYNGQTTLLVEHIETLAVGRRAKKIRSHEEYFTRNHNRMQYRSFAARHIPRGSGAIESAVRRIINLRLKSNAKFWKRANAEGMLLLRSYLKAGRLDELIDWSISRAAAWWIDAAPSPIQA